MKSLVNIAIIDDGVNQNIYNIGKLEHDIQVTKDLNICEMVTTGLKKEISHGTTCAAIIKKYSPDAVLSSIKILGSETMAGTREQLVKALQWCAGNKIQLINLSLGTIDFRDFHIIKAAVDHAVEMGIIIVAACNNRDIFTCPASLQNVIGVKHNGAGCLDEGEFIYNNFSPDGIEITAFSRHSLIKNSGETVTTSLCNSYAAPLITAAVSNILQDSPDASLKEIKIRLEEKGKKLSEKVICNQKTHKNLIKDLNIPIITVHDSTRENNYEVGAKLCQLFRNDGYNAVSICNNRSEEDLLSGMVSLENCMHCEGDGAADGIRRIYEIYDPDIIIAGHDILLNEDGIHRRYINKINSDVRIVISDKISTNVRGEIPESETVYLLTNSLPGTVCNDKNIFIYSESAICDIYNYILKLFETD